MDVDSINVYSELEIFLNERNETFTRKDEEDCLWIEIVRDDGDNIGIEISDEITLFFGNCHDHYSLEDEEYYGKVSFFKELGGLLDNEMCAVSAYDRVDEEHRWCGSMFAWERELNISFLKDMLGENRRIQCCFMDGSRDRMFET